METKNDHPCRGGLHDFVPIIEGSETVGLVCIIDGCGFSVREDMQRSEHHVDTNGTLFRSQVLLDGGSHRGQKGGRF